MSFSIQTNVSSLQAQENLRINQKFQSQTIQRLTSGYRINSSGDDAAGLAVANKFRSDITELSQGVRNSNDGVSQLQIVDGGLNNISRMLDRMKTLATQSASATFTGSRSTLNAEYSQLIAEIDREASNIGLNSGGKFASNISIYTGGSTDGAGSNAKVSVNLSSSAVDSTNLSLSGSTIASTSTKLAAAAAVAAPTTTSFTVNYVDSSGAQQTATVSGAGSTVRALVDSLNKNVSTDTTLSNLGVAFSYDGTSIYAGADSAAVFTGGANLLSGGAIAGGSGKGNYGMYVGGLTIATVADSGSQDVTLSNGNGTVSFNFALNTTAAQIRDAINQNGQAKAMGITIVSEGGQFLLHSSAGKVTVTHTENGGASGGVGALTDVNASAISSTSSATDAINRINAAVKQLGNVQGVVGAGQSQLQYAIQLAQSQIANFSAAESRIRDTDVAAEAANLTKAQVLQQASMAAMAQANSAPQAVLTLLRG